MAYRKHTVKQGECISSIADKYGLFPEDVWNDQKNRKLKDERKDPDVLMPGDAVYVRGKEENEESCASEERHRFRRKGVPEKLAIQFKVGDQPRAEEDYVLEVDGALCEGKTDKDGKIDVWVPPGAKKGKITFRAGGEYELGLAHLDPITETSGVQARLRNLALYRGPVDGKLSEELRTAIRRFQASVDPDVKPTGEIDEETRKRIQEAYGE